MVLWGCPLRRLHAYFTETPAPATSPAFLQFALDRLWTHPRAILRRFERSHQRDGAGRVGHLPLRLRRAAVAGSRRSYTEVERNCCALTGRGTNVEMRRFRLRALPCCAAPAQGRARLRIDPFLHPRSLSRMPPWHSLRDLARLPSECRKLLLIASARCSNW